MTDANLWTEDATEPGLGDTFLADDAAGPEPLTEYQLEPVRFAVDVLGIPEHTIRWSRNDGYAAHEWDGTPDPLVVMAEALADWQDVGAESATGTGKSFWTAALILWFLGSFKGARVYTFAPKEEQLRQYIWTEIGKMWPRFKARFPSAELIDLKIRMDSGTDAEDSWGAVGYAVGVRAGEQVATKAAGMHAEHMLIVNEETPGIHPAILAAQENTCTAPHNLRISIGNPDNQQDTLHRFCTSPGVVAVRISALDHPNVVTGNDSLVPGAVGRKSVERRVRQYGEAGRMYQSRIRGMCPTEAEEALIRLDWCKEAADRYGDPAYRVGRPAWGVDVANSEAGDKAALARWMGACLREVESFACPDANQLGAKVVAELKATKDGRATHVGIDSVGVGAGAVNEAKRLGVIVQALNGGARATKTVDERLDVKDGQKRVANEELFANLRAQMWWAMREDLRNGRVALVNDPELFADLTAPTWWTHNGKIHVEAKEDMKGRLGRSPDKGDAAVYGNWVRHRSPLPKEDEEEFSAFSPEALQASVQHSYRLGNRLNRKRRRPADSMFGDF